MDVDGAQDALIIGSGIAGSALAAVLCRRGHRVTLVAAQQSEQLASAVPAAVMAPPIGHATDPLSRIRLRGLHCTRAWLTGIADAGLDNGERTRGVLVRPLGERAWRRHGCLAHAPGAASAAGIEPPPRAIIHTRGAWLAPPVLAHALRTSCAERLSVATGHVRSVTRDRTGWHAHDDAGRQLATAAELIVAAGVGTGRLLLSVQHLLHPARGQATAFRASADTRALRLPISGGGYLTPAADGIHWVGATLQRGDVDTAPRAEDDRLNLELARTLLGLPEAPAPVDRFVGLRATTPNRIPLIGRCAEGAWVSAGHGAHGLLTGLLGAHLLADALAGRRHPWLRLTAPLERRDRGRSTDRSQ